MGLASCMLEIKSQEEPGLVLLDAALGAARTRALGGTGSCRHSPTAPGLETHCGIRSLLFQLDTPKPTSLGFGNRLFIANPV